MTEVKNDGLRVLNPISEYFCHLHQLLFRHRHRCPGAADFLVDASVHAVVGVYAVTRVPAVATVPAVAGVPAFASMPAVADVPPVACVHAVACVPAVAQFLGLFYHVDDGTTVKFPSAIVIDIVTVFLVPS